ncbi:hypothetical protein FSP39_017386 [Pinctada imbricata]|uniref:Coiled-coil domain-containing protein 137 n=1 Tax=Pinctada imbricata TaxID=66713 RepID=A0AA89C1S6_PINIB|nr:hypothetical protein FSP39_017386 [Pinctada imbricata]
MKRITGSVEYVIILCRKRSRQEVGKNSAKLTCCKYKMGKIGKPQKSRKNKKLKKFEGYDFETMNENRRGKGNLAPNDDDNQEIPGKVQFMIDRKPDLKKVKKKRKKPKTNVKIKGKKAVDVMEKGMTRPMKPAPVFNQGKKESDKQFLKRVEIETQRVLMKSKLSEKFKVDMDELESGNVKRRKKGMSENKKKRLNEKKAKKQEKRKVLQEDRDEDSKFQDRVGFGEVVMAPPTLTAKPRKSEQKLNRPGKKSLLLKEIIADNATVNPDSVKRANSRSVGQTLKRKKMSMAQQSIMDSERERVIDLYRQYKAEKYKVS